MIKKALRVYPACAGIDLEVVVIEAGLDCLPRMRGDRPYPHCQNPPRGLFTPHARGSTLDGVTPFKSGAVYPACAGIDPRALQEAEEAGCLPRMRGDRPFIHVFHGFLSMFTPHARGSTAKKEARNAGYRVYPACAGIDL